MTPFIMNKHLKCFPFPLQSIVMAIEARKEFGKQKRIDKELKQTNQMDL